MVANDFNINLKSIPLRLHTSCVKLATCCSWQQPAWYKSLKLILKLLATSTGYVGEANPRRWTQLNADGEIQKKMKCEDNHNHRKGLPGFTRNLLLFCHTQITEQKIIYSHVHVCIRVCACVCLLIYVSIVYLENQL